MFKTEIYIVDTETGKNKIPLVHFLSKTTKQVFQKTEKHRAFLIPKLKLNRSLEFITKNLRDLPVDKIQIKLDKYRENQKKQLKELIFRINH